MSWPIAIALLISASLFAAYMWILVSPIFKDKNILAPSGEPRTVPEYGMEENRRRARTRNNIDNWNCASAPPQAYELAVSDGPSHSYDYDKSPYRSYEMDEVQRFPFSPVALWRDHFSNATLFSRVAGANTPPTPLSPITPPPPAYVSYPSSLTPEYRFPDSEFRSPTPSSQEHRRFPPRTPLGYPQYRSPASSSPSLLQPRSPHSRSRPQSLPRSDTLTVPPFNHTQRQRSASQSTTVSWSPSSSSLDSRDGASASSRSSESSRGDHRHSLYTLPLGLSNPPLPLPPQDTQPVKRDRPQTPPSQPTQVIQQCVQYHQPAKFPRIRPSSYHRHQQSSPGVLNHSMPTPCMPRSSVSDSMIHSLHGAAPNVLRVHGPIGHPPPDPMV